MIKQKQRESNIELLRLTSMLIIVVYHFFINAIIPAAPELDYITKPLIAVLHIGVICFVLISGYWGIKFSLKGFTKVFIYCAFYSVLIYAAGCLLNPKLFNIKDAVLSFIPYRWWFIPVYLCLFVLAPIINIPLSRASNQNKLLFIILLAIVSFGFGQFTPTISDGKNPLNFIWIYYLGDYLRTAVKLPAKIDAKRIFIVYLALNAILFLVLFFSQLHVPIAGKVVMHLFYPYNSIGLIINASIFFLIFTRISISSKMINWFAGSTLAVYLLHENQYIGIYVYNFVAALKDQFDNFVLYFIVLVLIAASVVIVSVLIDKLLTPVIQFITRIVTDNRLFLWADKKVSELSAPQMVTPPLSDTMAAIKESR
ncbi:MAG: acyltransferase [Chitinophagaceae bacterium]|nr:MAG: acyltransferase [Chitinophagaceae bacterium]